MAGQKASCSLSWCLGNPERPPSCRRVEEPVPLTGEQFCGYSFDAPHPKTIWSWGLSNTRWRATVNSTVPRLDARCPPVRDKVETSSAGSPGKGPEAPEALTFDVTWLMDGIQH